MNKEIKYIENKVLPPTPFVQGEFVYPGSVRNRAINQPSRTFDAIVDINGGADFTSIEDAVEHVNRLGGGDIFVRAGTYLPGRTITITKPINIVGVSASLVTIEFNNTSRNFTIQGQSVYTTGTITAIASGVNVTGSGTSWLANAQAGYFLFLGTRWYKIAAVTSDTTLVLAEPYFDNVTLPSTYRIADIPTDVIFETLLIKSSTGTGVAATDCRGLFFIGAVIVLCNKAIVATNVSLILANGAVAASSTSNNVELTNCGIGAINGFQSNGSGGHGFVLNNVKVFNMAACEANQNTTDGFNITGCTLVKIQANCFSNGGQGIELVSGNSEIIMNECSLNGNTSDGIKLTASSDYCKILSCHFDTNGGWGINIAAATDDKNVVIGNSFNANTSGTVTDSGTGSVVASNTT